MNRLSVGMLVVLVLLGLLLWLGKSPQGNNDGKPATVPASQPGMVLRLGVIPERDILQQRHRYLALSDAIQVKLGWGVELVTVASYQDILKDFEARKIDAAFLGSMVAVLAADRLGARIVAKSELPDGTSSYFSEIFVREDSPIKTLADLSGKSLAMVPTTMGGQLFSLYALYSEGLLTSQNPARVVFVGTHDDAILAVQEGACDAGATKNLRLDDYLKKHPDVKLRILAHGDSAPENALTLRADLDETTSRQLLNAYFTLQSDEMGRKALAEFGVRRFVPCSLDEYGAIYRMCDRLTPVWQSVGIAGPPPKQLKAKGE